MRKEQAPAANHGGSGCGWTCWIRWSDRANDGFQSEPTWPGGTILFQLASLASNGLTLDPHMTERIQISCDCSQLTRPVEIIVYTGDSCEQTAIAYQHDLSGTLIPVRLERPDGSMVDLREVE